MKETTLYPFKNPLYLDIETTFQIDKRGKKNPTPYHPDNYLVSAGWQIGEGKVEYFPFQHSQIDPWDIPTYPFDCLQGVLDQCDILVAFNAKFELSWLRQCGFTYTGPIFDPMLVAYVLARGRKGSFSLDDLCNRYGTNHRKLGHLVDDYLRKNIGFQNMPWEVVQEYGINDVLAMKDLTEILLAEVEKNPYLWPTIDLTHEFCQCLTEIEEAGCKIDVARLDQIEQEFKDEIRQLNETINRIVSSSMGDSNVNLDSPEQLSQLIYSRKVKDKTRWKEIFNLGTEDRGAVKKPKRRYFHKPQAFASIVRENTELVYKTKAQHCEECHGKGSIQRIKSDGTTSTRFNKCSNCLGRGFTLSNTTQIGGLKCLPTGSDSVAVGGFSTDKETLTTLLAKAKTDSQKEFLQAITRKSQLEFYVTTFIERIRNGLDLQNLYHPRYMQHTTATGRLSSDLQNLPRGDKFPIRQCIVSRWKKGKIAKGDAKQLEFRIAGELSGSKMIFEDVINGIDVHAQTAKYTGKTRQDAKSDTFAPVYGATENGKSKEVAAYFRYFNDRYKLPDWHNSMCSDIIKSGGYYRTPSGREFNYGEVKRYANGSFSFATQIKNYGVQSFATADIIPIVCIYVWRLLKKYNLRSRIILELHDDFPIDVHPEEEEIVVKLIKEAWDNLPAELIRRYDYKIRMPLEVDIALGETLT